MVSYPHVSRVSREIFPPLHCHHPSHSDRSVQLFITVLTETMSGLTLKAWPWRYGVVTIYWGVTRNFYQIIYTIYCVIYPTVNCHIDLKNGWQMMHMVHLWMKCLLKWRFSTSMLVCPRVLYMYNIYIEYIFNIYSSICLPISSTESNQLNPSNQTKFNPIWVCLKMG
jgi:hypothetical protein